MMTTEQVRARMVEHYRAGNMLQYRPEGANNPQDGPCYYVAEVAD